MKTHKLKFLVTLTLLLAGAAVLQAQNDFRNTIWGMNAVTVKNTETCKISSQDQFRIVYECSLADLKGKLIYSFSNTGELMRSKYVLTPIYYSMNFYIKDYKMIEELLTEKYGAAIKKSVNSPSNKINISEGDWAVLLASGQLRVESIWSTPRTNILLTMSKISEKPTIQIDYISKEYNDKDTKERKAIILKNI